MINFLKQISGQDPRLLQSSDPSIEVYQLGDIYAQVSAETIRFSFVVSENLYTTGTESVKEHPGDVQDSYDTLLAYVNKHKGTSNPTLKNK